MRTWSLISPEMSLRNRLGKKRKILAVTLKKVLRTPLPLYLALLLAINVGILTAAGGYLLLTRGSSTQDPENLVKDLKAEVLPAAGYITSITWGDTGKKLIEVGAIDEKQYQQLFNSPTNGMDELDILKGGSTKLIGINENNSQFIVDTLWAFGLVQKSKVLDEGPMKNSGTELGNFASTGGWTLGKKSATKLYSSQELVQLNDFQQDLVKKIAESIYRPCCDNPTSFPDCNHGMAALGLIELEVAAGILAEQNYRHALGFNALLFPPH